MTSPAPKSGASSASRIVLACTLFLIALNLRPALADLGPVLPQVMRDIGLSPGQASLLAMLPILCLGFSGLAAPVLSRALGTERAVMLVLALLVAGNAVRIFPSFPLLLLAALLLGCGIGGLNVLMPGLIKRDFGDRVGAATALYTMALVLGAALGAGTVAPLMTALGGSWNRALAAWAVPAAFAGLVWLPQLRRAEPPVAVGASRPGRMWTDALAWQVTGFFALQSLLFYAMVNWLPTMLQERGYSAATSGLVVSLALTIQAAPALVVPLLVANLRSQSLAAAAVIVATMAGYGAMVYGPTPVVWGGAVVLGLAQGADLAVALTILVLRAGDARVAASLSGMAQGIGYLVAGVGPLMLGLLRSWTGGWGAGHAMLTVLALICIGCGLGAGRPLMVGREG